MIRPTLAVSKSTSAIGSPDAASRHGVIVLKICSVKPASYMHDRVQDAHRWSPERRHAVGESLVRTVACA